MPIDGDNLYAKITHIGDLKPGLQIEVEMIFLRPEECKTYKQTFQLMGNEENFGPILKAEFTIIPEEDIKDSNINLVKRLTEKIELLKHEENYDKVYDNNLQSILMAGDWDPKDVLKMLINNNNDANKVLLELINDQYELV